MEGSLDKKKIKRLWQNVFLQRGQMVRILESVKRIPYSGCLGMIRQIDFRRQYPIILEVMEDNRGIFVDDYIEVRASEIEVVDVDEIEGEPCYC